MDKWKLWFNNFELPNFTYRLVKYKVIVVVDLWDELFA